MARSRKNFSSETLGLTADEIQKGKKRWWDWHWYTGDEPDAPPVRVIRWKDPDTPRALEECGRLIRLQFRVPSRKNPRHPRLERDHMIEFSRSISDSTHLAFDPAHENQRLYILIPDVAKAAIKSRFWDGNDMAPVNLQDLSVLAGGKHGRRDYPDIAVKPIGIATAVVYWTPKRIDNQSYYIHQLGELTHYYPILSCDQQGRLWFAGGDYTCPRPGIDN